MSIAPFPTTRRSVIVALSSADVTERASSPLQPSQVALHEAVPQGTPEAYPNKPSVVHNGSTGDENCELMAVNNPVRFIHALVDGLDLKAAGFARAEAKATGHPGYAPGDLLKLYVYGHLNPVRSSRLATGAATGKF